MVDSTKTITVADQLHLSRFAGEIRGHYRRVVGSDGVASPDHRWVAKGTVADCATWTPPAASNRIVAQGWCGRVLTRTTSKLYFRRAVYVCGGHELSDEKRSVRSWITNVIHQILLRFHQMNHGYGVAASVACWLW